MMSGLKKLNNIYMDDSVKSNVDALIVSQACDKFFGN